MCAVAPMRDGGRRDTKKLCSFSARQISAGDPIGEEHASLRLVINNDCLDFSKFFLSKKVITNRVNF